ncbi:MAG: ASPIC/UnbV domain-containing protein, partial [Desulfofustis sp.]|nr:ASPIC/UnbV domain-containing protein [Desulfofustis sp.]
DFDNDGDLDIVFGDGIRWGGTLTDPPRTLAVFRNNGTANNWLMITLEGTRSNRSAIGAKVYLSATIRGETVQQMREVSSGSGHSCQNDLRVHFGLGDAALVELIRIEWPSGQVDELNNISPNQFLTIVEGSESI